MTRRKERKKGVAVEYDSDGSSDDHYDDSPSTVLSNLIAPFLAGCKMNCQSPIITHDDESVDGTHITTASNLTINKKIIANDTSSSISKTIPKVKIEDKNHNAFSFSKIGSKVKMDGTHHRAIIFSKDRPWQLSELFRSLRIGYSPDASDPGDDQDDGNNDDDGNEKKDGGDEEDDYGHKDKDGVDRSKADEYCEVDKIRDMKNNFRNKNEDEVEIWVIWRASTSFLRQGYENVQKKMEISDCKSGSKTVAVRWLEELVDELGNEYNFHDSYEESKNDNYVDDDDEKKRHVEKLYNRNWDCYGQVRNKKEEEEAKRKRRNYSDFASLLEEAVLSPLICPPDDDYIACGEEDDECEDDECEDDERKLMKMKTKLMPALFIFLTDDCILFEPIGSILRMARASFISSESTTLGGKKLNDNKPHQANHQPVSGRLFSFITRLHTGVTWSQTQNKPSLPPLKAVQYLPPPAPTMNILKRQYASQSKSNSRTCTQSQSQSHSHSQSQSQSHSYSMSQTQSQVQEQVYQQPLQLPGSYVYHLEDVSDSKEWSYPFDLSGGTYRRDDVELLLSYIRREKIGCDGGKNSQGKCVENSVANNENNGGDGNFAEENCRYDVRDTKEENESRQLACHLGETFGYSHPNRFEISGNKALTQIIRSARKPAFQLNPHKTSKMLSKSIVVKELCALSASLINPLVAFSTRPLLIILALNRVQNIYHAPVKNEMVDEDESSEEEMNTEWRKRMQQRQQQNLKPLDSISLLTMNINKGRHLDLKRYRLSFFNSSHVVDLFLKDKVNDDTNWLNELGELELKNNSMKKEDKSYQNNKSDMDNIIIERISGSKDIGNDTHINTNGINDIKSISGSKGNSDNADKYKPLQVKNNDNYKARQSKSDKYSVLDKNHVCESSQNIKKSNSMNSCHRYRKYYKNRKQNLEYNKMKCSGNNKSYLRPALSVLIPVRRGPPRCAVLAMRSILMQAIEEHRDAMRVPGNISDIDNATTRSLLSPMQVVIVDDECSDGSVNMMLNVALDLAGSSLLSSLKVRDRRQRDSSVDNFNCSNSYYDDIDDGRKIKSYISNSHRNNVDCHKKDDKYQSNNKYSRQNSDKRETFESGSGSESELNTELESDLKVPSSIVKIQKRKEMYNNNLFFRQSATLGSESESDTESNFNSGSGSGSDFDSDSDSNSDSNSNSASNSKSESDSDSEIDSNSDSNSSLDTKIGLSKISKIVLPLKRAGSLFKNIKSSLSSISSSESISSAESDMFDVEEEWDPRPDIVIDVIQCPTPGGVANALNCGLEICNSDLVARMDADDVVAPGRFFAQVEAMLASPCTKVLGTSAILFTNIKEGKSNTSSPDSSISPTLHLPPYTDPFSALASKGCRTLRPAIYPTNAGLTAWAMIFSCVLCHPSVIYRRSAIMNTLVTKSESKSGPMLDPTHQQRWGYDPSLVYAQDYDLWLRIILADPLSIKSLPHVGVWHSIRGGDGDENDDNNDGHGWASYRARQRNESDVVSRRVMNWILYGSNGTKHSPKYKESSKWDGKITEELVSALKRPNNCNSALLLDNAAESLQRLEIEFLNRYSQKLTEREVQLITVDCDSRIGDIATWSVQKFGRRKHSVAWGLWCKRSPKQELERLALCLSYGNQNK